MQTGLRLLTIVAIAIAGCLEALAASPYGLTNRNPVGPFFNNAMPPAVPGLSGAWVTVNAFPSLTFEDPTLLLPEPGTNRLYVCGRQGYVWFFQNDPAATNKTLFLDLHNQTQGWDDCGLVSMVFHPEYGQPGST